MATTTVIADVAMIVTSGFFVPLIVSMVMVAWAVGVMIKALKSKDLV